MLIFVIAATLLALGAGCAAFAMRWIARRLDEAFAPPPLMPEMAVLRWVWLAAITIEAARKLAVAALLVAFAMMVIA